MRGSAVAAPVSGKALAPVAWARIVMSAPSLTVWLPSHVRVATLACQSWATGLSPEKALPSMIEPAIVAPLAVTPPEPVPWSLMGLSMTRFSK